MGIEQRCLQKVNVHELADLMWATIVANIQLEDINADDKKAHRFKKSVLKLPERVIADSLGGKTK
jgi:hypothetical protein